MAELGLKFARMKGRFAGWRAVLPLTLMLITTISCASLGARPTSTPQSPPTATQPTPTPTTPTATPTTTETPTPTPTTPTPTPTPTTPTPTPTATATPPPPSAGPYVVKQIETLGGEVISGFVCSLKLPFSVNSVAPRVSFVFVFVPVDAAHGQVTYTYSIPSAGESHDAKGNYTISPAGTDGTLLLSLAVSDHVVFKGFDGNIPLKYKFDLVPSTTVTCP